MFMGTIRIITRYLEGVMPMTKPELYPFQKDAVQCMLNKVGFLLADEMGLG